MGKIDSCIICRNKNLKKYAGLVVPFIAQRVYNKESFSTYLIKCKQCGFFFFEERFDDNGLNRLYAGYRGEEYIKQRHENEPWYTKSLNERLFSSPESWSARRKALVKQAYEYDSVFMNHVNSVLDFGGDKGQLIYEILGDSKKFVYEISNVELLPGIHRADPNSDDQYDFIICSNVLEHVSYPEESVKMMFNMGKEGSVLYLEVPDEQPFSLSTLSKRVAQLLLLALFRPRLFLSMLKPGLFVHMHEHVNYFSCSSVSRLLKKMDYKDIEVEKIRINNSKFICAFARK